MMETNGTAGENHFEFRVVAQEFAPIFKAVVEHFCSKDGARPGLTGVLLRFDQRPRPDGGMGSYLTAVGTDSVKLAVFPIPAADWNHDRSIREDGPWLIPGHECRAIVQMFATLGTHGVCRLAIRQSERVDAEGEVDDRHFGEFTLTNGFGSHVGGKVVKGELFPRYQSLFELTEGKENEASLFNAALLSEVVSAFGCYGEAQSMGFDDGGIVTPMVHVASHDLSPTTFTMPNPWQPVVDPTPMALLMPVRGPTPEQRFHSPDDEDGDGAAKQARDSFKVIAGEG
jgi:hypothetical protein